MPTNTHISQTFNIYELLQNHIQLTPDCHTIYNFITVFRRITNKNIWITLPHKLKHHIYLHEHTRALFVRIKSLKSVHVRLF